MTSDSYMTSSRFVYELIMSLMSQHDQIIRRNIVTYELQSPLPHTSGPLLGHYGLPVVLNNSQKPLAETAPISGKLVYHDELVNNLQLSAYQKHRSGQTEGWMDGT
ncbi:hypothetical protein Tcan_01025, partial [Toxocara canis]